MVAEMCFFKPWFESLGDEDKTKVRDLIKEGRIDIVNGGDIADECWP
jgi:hypothetical protein